MPSSVVRVPLCTVCSSPIKVRYPSRLNGRKSCGQKCRKILRHGENAYQWKGGEETRLTRQAERRRQRSEETREEREGQRTERKKRYWPEYQCAHCGARFCRIRSWARKFARSFCDSRCQYAYLREHPALGEKHPRYKGGKRTHYDNASWRQLRRSLLQQTRYCMDCHVGKRLLIHHLLPIADGGTDHYLNLVVLCRRCHMRWHRLGSQMRLV